MRRKKKERKNIYRTVKEKKKERGNDRGEGENY